jgi:hypothetical protein
MGLDVRAVANDDRARQGVLWKNYLGFYAVDLAPEVADNV